MTQINGHAEPPAGNRDIIMLSTADWDNPFWTNKQHVAVELANRGYQVFYVDSLGLRRPSASRQDLHRILRRLIKAMRPPRKVHPNVWVWSPIAVPVQGNALVRRFNRSLLSLGLQFWLRVLRINRTVLWTYNPITSQLFPIQSFEYVIYHCVDEIKAQPGMPIEVIVRCENELVRRADTCFVTSEHLLDSRRRLNSNTHYFPNVADFSHFSKALDPNVHVPKDLAEVRGPIVGFIGAISAYKLDFILLKRIAEKHPEWSIILIGKVGEGDPGTDISTLNAMKNLRLLGPRQYDELPAYLKGFDVAILPNVINEYTRNMFPMKFFEYLAAGKQVVATDLPALRAFSRFVVLAKDHEDFIAGIESTLRGEGPSLDCRLELARQHTYELRTEKMLGLLPIAK
jgi:glycosyltransferase involved in cell wall biosynthesis